MKKYIEPKITLADLDNECLLAGSKEAYYSRIVWTLDDDDTIDNLIIDEEGNNKVEKEEDVW